LIDCNIATVTFAADAKLDWHIHPAGQILLITEETGYYQEKGKPIQVVHKGDAIKCVSGYRTGMEQHPIVRSRISL
jgi:quercetin dioxygenase-like cupin family protein